MKARDQALQERLRRELPELADELVAASEAVRDDTILGSAGEETALRALDVEHLHTGPGHTGADRRRWGRRTARLAAAAALVAVLGVMAFRLADESSSIDAVDAPAEFGTWEPIEAAPIEARSFASVGWTGTEAVFWAGSSLDRRFAYADAAAYDPAADRWRELPVPGWGHPGLVSAYVDGAFLAAAKGSATRIDLVDGMGTELATPEGFTLAGIVAVDDAVWSWGLADLDPLASSGLTVARYDAVADAWVDVWALEEREAGTVDGAEPVVIPFDTPALWTGSEIIWWPSLSSGVAFDPETGSWRVLEVPRPPSGLISDVRAEATGLGLTLLIEVVDADGPSASVALLAEGGWRWLHTDIPFADFSSVTTASAGDWLVAFSDAEGPALVHLPTGVWARNGGEPVMAPNTVWTGTSLIVWGGSGDRSSEPAGARWTPPASD